MTFSCRRFEAFGSTTCSTTCSTTSTTSEKSLNWFTTSRFQMPQNGDKKKSFKWLITSHLVLQCSLIQSFARNTFLFSKIGSKESPCFTICITKVSPALDISWFTTRVVAQVQHFTIIWMRSAAPHCGSKKGFCEKNGFTSWRPLEISYTA